MSATSSVWPGDIVINSLWAWHRVPSAFLDITASSARLWRVSTARSPNDQPRVHRCYCSIDTVSAGSSRFDRNGIWTSGCESTGRSLLKRIRLPCHRLAEQAAIVRFLDHADRRIRRYIRAKQKLIKLLEEQKQAIIHRAVTRGLDPNVRLKPSGVEWLGDVPEHWEVRAAQAADAR